MKSGTFGRFMKAFLIMATIVAFGLNMEVLAWITLTRWTWIGLFKFLEVLEKAGAFNE